MNWGYGIMLVIAAFIAAMCGMVSVAMRQTNDMVDKNYYAQELKYQHRIDAAHNLQAISSEPLLIQRSDSVVIQMPDLALAAFKNGHLEFLRNDDQRKDIELDFLPNQDGLFLMDKNRFEQGQYKVRIQWESQGKSYYKEEELNVTP